MMTDRRQTGSALLATLIITGGIAVTVIALTKFALVEVRTATALEDSAVAYAAAEAGIEEALLRWRFDRNAEIPANTSLAPIGDGAPRQVALVNLTTGSYTPSVAEGSAVITRGPRESVYEARMTYREERVGSADPADLARADYPFRLFKDQTLELDVTNLRGKNLALRWQVVGGTTARIESRVVHEDPVTHLFEETCESGTCKQLWPENVGVVGGGPLIIDNIPFGQDGLGYRLRIKPFIFANGTPAADTSFINYSIEPVPDGAGSALIDTGVTTIESTGYYGTAQRKLVAKLDRRSGTLLGIYDYVLYTVGDLGRP